MSALLTIIQIISIIQGLFLGYILLQKRKEFISPSFWVFIGGIGSVILFSIGDDNYNLFFEDTGWYFFHEPLIITFFFLLIRSINLEYNVFKKNDYLAFLPYGLFVLFETLSNSIYFKDIYFVEAIKAFVELSFIFMLIRCIYDILKFKKVKWLLIFLVPFTILYTLDEALNLCTQSTNYFFGLDSFGVFLIIILLFYIVIYKLIFTPNQILPIVDNKYSLSKLDKKKVALIQQRLEQLMTEEKLFKKQKLNADEVALSLKISKQQLSEVLNIHMKIRFQDLLNQYRVEEFIDCLFQETYKNYSLLGLATEVGFNSKSSFNATFKKIKGITPSQYKKQNTI